MASDSEDPQADLVDPSDFPVEGGPGDTLSPSESTDSDEVRNDDGDIVVDPPDGWSEADKFGMTEREERRIASAGAVVGDRMAGIAGADEDHRRTPVAISNTVAGEGISEYRHQRPVGRNHRRAQVGAGHAPPIGDAGTGDVGQLALFATRGTHRSQSERSDVSALPSRSRMLVPMAPSWRGMHRLDRVEMRFVAVG